MSSVIKLLSVAALTVGFAATAAAQQPRAGNKDDQVVITGCVMRSGDSNTSGPRSLVVWSRGDFYLESALTQIKPSERGGLPVGTAGAKGMVFYWIDDENDLKAHAGHQVEIIGELSDDLEKGEFEIDHDGKSPFAEVEFTVKGREAKVQVPSAWLGPATTSKDAEFDILVRMVDVEKVNMLGNCSR